MMLSDKREKWYPYLLYLLPLLSLLGIFRASHVFLCFDVAVSLLSHLSSLSSLLHLFAHSNVLHTLTHFRPPDFLVILSSFSLSVILTRLFSSSFVMFALLVCYSHNQSQHVHDIEIKTPSCVQEGPTMYSMFPLIFIPFLPTEPDFSPVYELNSHVEGPASYSTDQVGTKEGVDVTDFSHMHATVHIWGICINTVVLVQILHTHKCKALLSET